MPTLNTFRDVLDGAPVRYSFDADPTVTSIGFDADIGSSLVRTDVPGLYFKQAAGATAGWLLVASQQISAGIYFSKPLGGGLDDAPHLSAELALYPAVFMMPGAWTFLTPCVRPNGSIVIGTDRTIVTTIMAQAAPVDFSPCGFFALGPRDLALTTLVGNHSSAANQVTVASTAGLAVGRYVLIEHGALYWTLRKIIAIVGAVLTLDRPLLRPYSNNDVVSLCDPAHHIITIGNGMQMVGSGVAPVLYVTEHDCHTTGLQVTSQVTAAGAGYQFGITYDVASRDSTIEECPMDCANLTPNACLLAFGGENIGVIACDGSHSTAAGACIFIETNVGSYVKKGVQSEAFGAGVLFTVIDVGDTVGCIGCDVDTTVLKSASQGVVFGVATACKFRGESSFCAISGIAFSTGAQDNTAEGALCRGNVILQVQNSGNRNRCVDVTCKDFNGGVWEGFAGDMTWIGGVIDDLSTDAATIGELFAINSANTILRLSGVICRVNRNARFFTRCTHATGKIYIDSNCHFRGDSTNNWGVLCNAGVVVVDAFVADCPGVNGIGLFANGGSIRMGDSVNVSTCNIPLLTGGAGQFNRGQVVLNGVNPVAIAFADTNAQDRLWLTPLTAAIATAGSGLTVVKTAGVGFTVAAQAADIGTVLEYKINP